MGEHIFGLKPCILCLYQRYVQVLATIFAGVVAFVLPKRTLYGLVGCSLLLLVVAGIALYQVGVEEHWVKAPAICAGGLQPATTIEELQRQIASNNVVPCDRPGFTLFGISLAGYNVMFSLFLVMVCFVGIGAGSKVVTRHAR